MKKNIFGILMFTAGTAVGAVVGIKLVKTKYEKLAKEEIEAVREYYASKKAEITKAENDQPEVEQLEVVKGPDGEENIDEYLDLLENYGYVTKKEEEPEKKIDDKNSKEKEIVTVEDEHNTILITPEELGEVVDEETGQCFDVTTLVYYADGVMVYYDDEHLVDDIEKLVGTEFKEHFGDHESDAVFVRNFDNETDYEIIKDDDKYYDIWPKERGGEDE